MLTLLLFGACTSSIEQSNDPLNDKDSGDSGDSGGVTDSDDTGGTDTSDTSDTGNNGDFDSAEGNYPYNCGSLTTPITVSSHDDFLTSLPLVPLDQFSLQFALTRAEEWRIAGGGDCSDVVFDGAGRTILDGDCTTEAGVVFSGLAVIQHDESFNATYELEEFTVTAVEGEDSLYLWADGDLTLTAEGGQTADMHYIYEATGELYPTGSGEFIRHQETVQDGFNISGKGYVEVLASESWPLGELCFEADYANDMSLCNMEAIGTGKLTGDAVVEAVMDGDVACDSCINMTIDGVDQGSVCL